MKNCRGKLLFALILMDCILGLAFVAGHGDGRTKKGGPDKGGYGMTNTWNTQLEREQVEGAVQSAQPEEKKQVAITFDDGPYPNLTRQLLDGLRQRDVKASFFVLGKNVELYPDVIETMHADGHLIGNHTYHHVQLTETSEENFIQEIVSTNEAIERITGEQPQFIRPPYGSWDAKYEEKMSMLPVLWDVDPLDWCCTDAECIRQKVVTKVKENDIILMHDCYESSVTAAFLIIDTLRESGYEFVTVDEILLE